MATPGGRTLGPKEHINYSFRTMARDQVDVMAVLGYGRLFVAGHDRGARTAHCMALDHPERARKGRSRSCLPGTYNTPGAIRYAKDVVRAKLRATTIEFAPF